MTYHPPTSRILSMSADLSKSYLLQIQTLDDQIAALDAHPTLTVAAHNKIRKLLIIRREAIMAAYESDKQKFCEMVEK